MTKAANLANLASNTNFGILNIYRGGTGRGTYSSNGVLYYTTSNTIIQVGILPTNIGGTGLASFNVGGALYATSSSTLTSNTLPVVSGGTGVVELANNCILIGRGLNPVDTIAPGSPNNVIISDGTKWYSANATTRGIGIIPRPSAANNILIDTGNDWVSRPSYGLGLSPGTANSIYVSNGTTWLSQSQSTLNVIGAGQSWTSLSWPADRTPQTQYTNTTGKPIMLSVVFSSNSSLTTVRGGINVGAVTIANTQVTSTGNTETLQAFVPHNSTYMVSTSNTLHMQITSWAELR